MHSNTQKIIRNGITRTVGAGMMRLEQAVVKTMDKFNLMEVGFVSAVDAEHYKVKCTMPYKEDIESKWLRVYTPFASKLEGIVALPNVGDNGLIHFILGDENNGVFFGSTFNQSISLPVTKAPLKEKDMVFMRNGSWVQWKENSDIEIHHYHGNEVQLTEGKVEIQTPQGQKIVIQRPYLCVESYYGVPTVMLKSWTKIINATSFNTRNPTSDLMINKRIFLHVQTIEGLIGKYESGQYKINTIMDTDVLDETVKVYNFPGLYDSDPENDTQDTIIESADYQYASNAIFPQPGELDKLYLALDTKQVYQWTGWNYLLVKGIEYHYANQFNSFSKQLDYMKDTNAGMLKIGDLITRELRDNPLMENFKTAESKRLMYVPWTGAISCLDQKITEADASFELVSSFGGNHYNLGARSNRQKNTSWSSSNNPECSTYQSILNDAMKVMEAARGSAYPTDEVYVKNRVTINSPDRGI